MRASRLSSELRSYVRMPSDRNTRLTDEQDKKLMRKIDLWLIPWLCLLYLLSFLGSSNLITTHVQISI